ncbi:hypothetical protein Hdeb2414_s0377g00880751 [Helianthus debilis subsp. tardiflorus]
MKTKVLNGNTWFMKLHREKFDAQTSFFGIDLVRVIFGNLLFSKSHGDQEGFY